MPHKKPKTKMGRNKQGRFSDRKTLSGEASELKYVRAVARKLLEENWMLGQAAPLTEVKVKRGQLIRICEAVDRYAYTAPHKRPKHYEG